MAETSLSDVVKRLQQEGQLTRNSGTNSIKSIKEILLEDQKGSLADKEEKREQAVRDQKQLDLLQLMASNGSKSTDILKNAKAPESGLGGLGVALLGAGVGLGAAGAGLGAFFMGLAGAEAIMSKFGNGENLKMMLKNLSEGLASFQTRDLVAVGAVLGMGAVAGAVPGLSGVGAGMGMGAVGAGLGAFFAGLAAGDVAMSWMNTDMTKLKLATKGLSDALKELDDRSLTAVGGLLAGGAAAGALFGPRRVGKATIGMGAIGLGIGAFFAGLAAGDAAMNWMSTDGTKLKNMMINLGEGLNGLAANPAGLNAVGALLGAGAAGAALFGPSKVGQAAIGMGAIGLGIGAFFAGLAAGDAAATWMSADGGKLKSIMTNVAEGLNAFSGQSMIAVGGLLAAGALFGTVGTPVAAGAAAVGMAAIGAGLGGFMLGLAGIGELASWMGVDGSGIKTMMTNIAEGLNSFNNLQGDNFAKIVPALGLLGPALISFLAGNGLASITQAVMDSFTSVWNWLTGADPNERKPSMIQQIVDMLEPLNTLDVSKISMLDTLSSALTRMGQALDTLSGVRIGSLKDTFETLAKSVAYAIPLINKMWEGGVIGEGWGDGYPEINFGAGLRGIPLEEVNQAMSQLRSSLQTPSSLEALPDRATQLSDSIQRANATATVGQIQREAAASATGNTTVGVDNSTRINQRSDTVYMETEMSARDPWSNGDYIAP